jgi:hypothetical protein
MRITSSSFRNMPVWLDRKAFVINIFARQLCVSGDQRANNAGMDRANNAGMDRPVQLRHQPFEEAVNAGCTIPSNRNLQSKSVACHY